MKKATAILMLGFLCFSCVTRKATIHTSNPITEDVIEAKPEWTPTTKGFWIFPILGLAGGAAYGYEAEPISREVTPGSENAAAYGLIGGFGGMILSGIVVSTQKNKKILSDVKAHDYNKWIRKYNKNSKNKQYYVLRNNGNGKLVLASTSSRKNIEGYLITLKDTDRKLENAIDKWSDFSKYDQIVNSEYSKLFQDETHALEVKIADKKANFSYNQINNGLNLILNTPTSLSKAEKLSNFKQKSVYKSFSPYLSTWQESSINDEIRQGINQTLTSLIETEKQEISTWDNSFGSLKKAEVWYNSFRMQYKGFEDNSVYTNTINDLREKITTIYRSNKSLIKNEIDRLSTSKDIDIYTKALKVDITAFAQGYQVVTAIGENRKKELLTEFGFDVRTESLSNGKFIKEFLIGDSKNMSIRPASMELALMIKHFMFESSKTCTDADDVQIIYSQECKTEKVTRNGWGAEISRYCVEYVDVPTGFYTSRALYQAYRQTQNKVDRNALGNAFKILGAWATGRTTEGAFEIYPSSLQSDMRKFISYHGCSNPILKRFEENIVRFSNDTMMKKF